MKSKVFGDKLSELRNKAGLTQIGLADKLGMKSDKQIQRYEAGQVPDHAKMLELNKIFKYDFYCLLCEIKPTSGSPVSIETNVLLEIKSLSLENQNYLKDLKSRQMMARAEIRAFGEYQVMKDANDDEKSRKNIMAQINKLVRLNLLEDQKKGNHGGTRK